MESFNILKAPLYSERQLIRKRENRFLIRKTIKSEEGSYIKITSKMRNEDPGMDVIHTFQEETKQEGFKQLPKEYAHILWDLSASTSTICQFQPFDNEILREIKENLQNPAQEILIDTENFALKQNIMRIAPLMISRLEKIGKMTGAHGKLPISIRKIYIAIIEFSISYYESCPERSIDDYINRTGREIKSK